MALNLSLILKKKCEKNSEKYRDSKLTFKNRTAKLVKQLKNITEKQ